jgi:hypothetical protein
VVLDVHHDRLPASSAARISRQAFPSRPERTEPEAYAHFVAATPDARAYDQTADREMRERAERSRRAGQGELSQSGRDPPASSHTESGLMPLYFSILSSK